ncbi:hypothetical protein RRG08_022634 [Elysia crispata]|uniref:Uncharacterized protein n=1 Tax=Elysia crispata TaxID=231223 RepID=A0AAE1D8C1_9GAST|nr:hypothetical protein RRG08_022634 [Elysia crispata]
MFGQYRLSRSMILSLGDASTFSEAESGAATNLSVFMCVSLFTHHVNNTLRIFRRARAVLSQWATWPDLSVLARHSSVWRSICVRLGLTTPPSDPCGAGAVSGHSAAAASCPPSSSEADSLPTAPPSLLTLTVSQCVGLVLLLTLAVLALFRRSSDVTEVKISPDVSKTCENKDNDIGNNEEGKAERKEEGEQHRAQKGRNPGGSNHSSAAPSLGLPRRPFLTPPTRRKHAWGYNSGHGSWRGPRPGSRAPLYRLFSAVVTRRDRRAMAKWLRGWREPSSGRFSLQLSNASEAVDVSGRDKGRSGCHVRSPHGTCLSVSEKCSSTGGQRWDYRALHVTVYLMLAKILVHDVYQPVMARLLQLVEMSSG